MNIRTKSNKRMLKGSPRHPSAHLHWWQMAAASLLGFGILSILLFLLPSYSRIFLIIGIALSSIGTITSIWSWWTYNWFARLIVAIIGSLFFVGITFRAWAEIAPFFSMWLSILMVCYILAWVLPALNPSFSAYLWREQTAPQTRFGRAFLGVMLTVAPIAGVLGASFGMYGSRSGEIDLTLIVIGVLCSMVAIGFAFAFSYQIWPDRPWAQSEKKGEP
jgi:hypothetical protein